MSSNHEATLLRRLLKAKLQFTLRHWFTFDV
jgi:hypothetical protein